MRQFVVLLIPLVSIDKSEKCPNIHQIQDEINRLTGILSFFSLQNRHQAYSH